jgi:hypothetical protein
MLTLLGSPRRCCNGLTRRETLRAGTLSALGGLSLAHLASATSPAGEPFVFNGAVKQVITLFLLGGPATQDMWDLKPNGPVESRGEFKPIATTAPGFDVSEHLPGLARWAHRCAVVRTVNHQAGCHNPLPGYTGYGLPVDNLVTTKDTYPPSMGAVCEYLSGARAELPAYAYLPNYLGWGQSIRRPGPYAGFLGSRYDALTSECAPYVDDKPDLPQKGQPLRGVPSLPNTKLEGEMTVDRLSKRQSLLGQLDAERSRMDRSLGGPGPSAALYNRQQDRAWSILTSSRVREAFDLDRVDPAIRSRYTDTLFGQSTLVAKRLVESGVRFVNVTWDAYWERLNLQYDCWDTHWKNFDLLKRYLLPYFDLTFTALMEDLDQSGLLDETLVVVMGEMGRGPRVNGSAGRDHWPFCYSTLLAGGGIRGGTVYGTSDAQAAYPQDKPVSPADICATVYQALGIDPDLTVPDQLARPHPIANGGKPIWDILA